MRHFAVLLIVFCGTPTFAAPTASKVVNVQAMIGSFADCLVQHDAPFARGLVLQVNVLQSSSLRRLFDQNHGCQIYSKALVFGENEGSRVSFPGASSLFAIAEALVRKDYPVGVDYVDPSGRPRISYPPLVPFDDRLAAAAAAGDKTIQERKAWRDAYAQHLILVMFTDCVSRRDARGVHNLLLTESGGTKEAAAFSALSKPLGECLADGQIQVHKDELRGALALSFYKLAGAPTGVGVAQIKVNP